LKQRIVIDRDKTPFLLPSLKISLKDTWLTDLILFLPIRQQSLRDINGTYLNLTGVPPLLPPKNEGWGES
jgi:hypothetical protein